MPSEPISVMSWNIQGGNLTGEQSTGRNAFFSRVEAIQDTLLEVSPSVAAFQEFVPENYLDVSLGLQGNCLECGESISHRLSLPLAWLLARFSLKENGVRWLSPTPEVASIGWDAKHLRAFSFWLLHDLVEDISFLVINTHFDHKGAWARMHSAQLIVDYIETHYNPKTPIIIMGDFNCGPWRPTQLSPYNQRPYEMFLGAGFQDAYRTVNPSWPPMNTFHGYRGEEYTRKPDQYGTWMIDFIFVRNFRVLSSRIIRFREDSVYPSDHYPVFADLAYIDK